jgi:hypothetical protein
MVEQLEVGTEVRTAYGWGVLRSGCPQRDHYTVDLDWGNDSARNRPVLYCKRSELLEQSAAAVGTVVLTKYGVGVLVEYRRADRMHILRMWSLGYKSATAYMTSADIIRYRLP